MKNTLRPAESWRPLQALIWLSLILEPGYVLQAQNIKVAFVRAGEVEVGNADGTGVHVLTHGADADEQMPHWSADGKKILFTSPTKKKHVLKELVVISADDGHEVSRISIDQNPPKGGTIWNAMNFVEYSGWINEDTAYVAGSQSPQLPSLETFTMGKRTATALYYPSDFAICPAKARFAQAELSDRSIVVNEQKIYTVAIGYVTRDLTWNYDCTRLAFLLMTSADDAEPPEFVVLRGGKNQRTRLPRGFDSPSVYAVGETYVAAQTERDYLEYNMATQSFGPPSKAVQERIRLKDKITQTFRDLGIGGSIELWPDVLTGQPPTTQTNR